MHIRHPPPPPPTTNFNDENGEKFIKKKKTKKKKIILNPPPPRKSCHLGDNVETYGKARQATNGNILGRMRFACLINMTIGAHLEYIILIASPLQQWLRQRYSICRLYVQYTACVVSFLLSMSNILALLPL